MSEELTDKTPSANRGQVHPQKIQDAVESLQQKLIARLTEKGYGTLSSRHEVLGMLTEEMSELTDAVRCAPLKGEVGHTVESELLDIAVGAVFGIACIRAGMMDW